MVEICSEFNTFKATQRQKLQNNTQNEPIFSTEVPSQKSGQCNMAEDIIKNKDPFYLRFI